MNAGSDYQLSSARVTLRRLRPGDAGALFAYRSLPEVSRYQGWEAFGPDDAAHLIAGQAEAKPGVPGTWFQWAIIETATGIMAGDCGLHCRMDDPRQMEAGITLAPGYQGRGYATETMHCLLEYTFAVLGKHRISTVTDADNHAAAALMRRVGFRQEAHFIDHLWFKGQWGSEFVFGLLKREWEAQK